jgi:hypothetical protein
MVVLSILLYILYLENFRFNVPFSKCSHVKFGWFFHLHSLFLCTYDYEKIINRKQDSCIAFVATFS